VSLLEAREVGKRYGPVVALESANLSVDAGEVHALLGANGAGKSTFVKILTGVIQRDGGSVELRGEPVRVSSPSQAARIGLAPVFQDPALAHVGLVLLTHQLGYFDILPLYVVLMLAAPAIALIASIRTCRCRSCG